MGNNARILFFALILGALAGALASFAVMSFQNQEKSESDYIREFYLTENAVHVSPHSLRGRMDKGIDDFILVDLRSAEEYETEHVVGAVSIPAYRDKDTSDYGAVDRIVSSFAALPKGKEIIVYCYSMPCMTGRKIGKMLADLVAKKGVKSVIFDRGGFLYTGRVKALADAARAGGLKF